uniref:Uncharacterized protein n=1 Tax=Tanacetum cinerariifolium TaxID=118510 RepID=A0A6L2LC58_TANCI|nr:hypothetical protein [Tanacetum cinerariifolium]
MCSLKMVISRYYGEESAEAGSPGAIVYGYDGLPMQPVAPPSPDYVPRPEHPPSPDYVPGPEHPPSPVEIPYVPEPEYPEYLVPSDAKAPLEDQPLPADASPTVASLGYVADFDSDKDPEEDPEDDHADYPADGGNGDDEPFDDDDDNDDNDDEDEEPFEDEEDDKEEEHLALTDSFVVPIVDLVPPAKDIEALEADEHVPIPISPHTIISLSQTRLRRVRKTIKLELPMQVSIKACITRHVALLLPSLPIPSPPLPLPSPLTNSPTDTGAPLCYRVARIRMRALLPSTSRRTDIPEADVPPRKRVCLTTLALEFEVEESFAAGAARQPWPTKSDLRRYKVEQTGYGITDTWDKIVATLMEIAPTTLEEGDSEDRSAAIAAYVRTLEAQVAALIAQTSSLQTQLTIILGRIEILEARDPKPQKGPAEAGNSFVYLIVDYGLILFIFHSSCYVYDLMKSNVCYIPCDFEENGTQEKTTRATPATTTIPTTTVTNTQLQALIDRGVVAALVEHDADMSRNGDNNNDSGTGGRRQASTQQECNYTHFLKCQPMNF